MAAREKWTAEYVCPECGMRAVIDVSEDDHPYQAGFNRDATVRVGRATVRIENKTEDVMVTCENCKREGKAVR